MYWYHGIVCLAWYIVIVRNDRNTCRVPAYGDGEHKFCDCCCNGPVVHSLTKDNIDAYASTDMKICMTVAQLENCEVRLRNLGKLDNKRLLVNIT